MSDDKLDEFLTTKLVNNRVLPSAGDGDCVAVVQEWTGASHTSTWRQGEPVRGNDIPVGTAIASFENGRYPNRSTGNHAAIYLGQNSEGLIVLDQWRSLGRAQIRVIRFKGGDTGIPSNNGNAFSVIESQDTSGTCATCGLRVAFGVGIYVVDGQPCGLYGRLSARPLIDDGAQDVLVLVRR